MKSNEINKRERNNNFDLLRGISCVTVVMLHVSAVYLKDDFVGSIISENNYNVAYFFRVITNLAVPSFVMLSGAYLFNSKNKDYKIFYRKMYSKIAFPTIVFSAIYIMMHYLEMAIATFLGITFGNGENNILSPIINFIKGEPHKTMWFMFMIMGLYVITPVLIRVKESITWHSYIKLSICLFVYGFLIAKTCQLSWILSFSEWIGYFVLGNMLYDYFNNIRNKRDVDQMIGILCIGAAYCFVVIQWVVNVIQKDKTSIPGLTSWSIIVGTISQFIGFSLLRQSNRRINLFEITAKYSLGIYLIHPLLCELYMQIFGRIIRWFPPAYYIPIISLAISAISLWIAKRLDGLGLLCRK